MDSGDSGFKEYEMAELEARDRLWLTDKDDHDLAVKAFDGVLSRIPADCKPEYAAHRRMEVQRTDPIELYSGPHISLTSDQLNRFRQHLASIGRPAFLPTVHMPDPQILGWRSAMAAMRKTTNAGN